MPETLRALLEHPGVRHARALVHAGDARTLADQLDLVRVPAPPFGEEERGRRLAELFRDAGLEAVGADGAGNVIGRLARAAGNGGSKDEEPVVLAAHLDTVFPAGTAVEPREADGRWHAPGIVDNARGLAGMLAVARALGAAGLRTRRPLLFAGTVGEEGNGDLRGVKHLFREGAPLRDAAAFVALDGSGTRRIVHRAVGARRLRIVFRAPGGHSWADRGAANPVSALGRTVAAAAELRLPEPDRSSCTVARVEGGTSVNAMPAEAWMEVDMRSEVPSALARIEAAVRGAAERAAATENRVRRAGTPALTMEVELIGDRPAGETPTDAPLVRAAVEVTEALGARADLASSSTDANVPLSLGIPSIAIGVGGEGGGTHTPDEWYVNDGGAVGVERALLIALAAAGLEEG